jgi:hypothetical protein
MKKKIKISKDDLKGLKYEVKIVPHSTEPICYCPDCIEMMVRRNVLIEKYKTPIPSPLQSRIDELEKSKS